MSHLRPLLFVVALLGVGACAAKTGTTEARWVTLDGRPADPVALDAATARCEARVSGRFQARERYDSLAWGVAVVECMESEGFVRESSPSQ